jgi:hypothetical protein
MRHAAVGQARVPPDLTGLRIPRTNPAVARGRPPTPFSIQCFQVQVLVLGARLPTNLATRGIVRAHPGPPWSRTPVAGRGPGDQMLLEPAFPRHPAHGEVASRAVAPLEARRWRQLAGAVADDVRWQVVLAEALEEAPNPAEPARGLRPRHESPLPTSRRTPRDAPFLRGRHHRVPARTRGGDGRRGPT